MRAATSRVSDRREDSHPTATFWAAERVDLENTPKEFGPGNAALQNRFLLSRRGGLRHVDPINENSIWDEPYGVVSRFSRRNPSIARTRAYGRFDLGGQGKAPPVIPNSEAFLLAFR